MNHSTRIFTRRTIKRTAFGFIILAPLVVTPRTARGAPPPQKQRADTSRRVLPKKKSRPATSRA